MNKVQAQRLLDVATALRESPDKKKFSMRTFHDCGTPCCALGHYAARIDFQSFFELVGTAGLKVTKTGENLNCDYWDGAPKYFGLSLDETIELFGLTGCGNAKTPIQAAKYIEKFLDEKEWSAAA